MPREVKMYQQTFRSKVPDGLKEKWYFRFSPLTKSRKENYWKVNCTNVSLMMANDTERYADYVFMQCSLTSGLARNTSDIFMAGDTAGTTTTNTDFFLGAMSDNGSVVSTAEPIQTSNRSLVPSLASCFLTDDIKQDEFYIYFGHSGDDTWIVDNNTMAVGDFHTILVSFTFTEMAPV